MTNKAIQRYYSEILSAKRINGPSFQEAAIDFSKVRPLVYAAPLAQPDG